MENKEKIKLTINELPPRAEKLSLEKLADIFGGSGGFGASCDKPTDCISMICKEGHCGSMPLN